MTENRLASETSPYLLQHKDNPVHWFAWSNEAFEEARQTGRPILLSIGYAACHWCHVMAHESFEDQQTADVMNALFVNIKVDREERPDVDKIYMDAIHSLGEQGGWPLTIFMNADAVPFWGGTYFPKTPQYGRPSFQQVLQEISRIWIEERGKVDSNATAISQALQRNAEIFTSGQLNEAVLAEAASTMLLAVDFEYGGLLGAPKFPQTSIFGFLWQMYHRHGQDRARRAVDVTLTNICQGGIYDHLAGGFARYSVDHRWLVPHFEKMLYDNAQLIELLVNVWVVTKNELFRIRIEQTVEWLLADMSVDDAAFAASYDADSDGVEGKFYVWSKAEIADLLPEDTSKLFCDTYNVTENGNWDGTNIPNRLNSPELLPPSQEDELSKARDTLLAARARRIPPAWDDKILTDWNGLAIVALAKAGLILQRSEWIDAACRAFDYILNHLWRDGLLFHSRREGRTRHHATADDYANMIAAAIALYQATANFRYVANSKDLVAAMNAQHWSEIRGGYYFSSDRAENLIIRPIYAHDDATPNANATMLKSLTDMSILTGDAGYLERAQQIHDAFAGDVRRVHTAHAGFLTAFDHFLNPVQAVVVGPADSNAAIDLKLAIVHNAPPTALLVHADTQQELPASHIAKTQSVTKDTVAAFICRGQTCSPPIDNPIDVAALFNNPDSSR